MEYFIGFTLAVAVSLFATWVGLDRDRAFYPTVTIVVASYYALFAVMGGSGDVLAAEIAATAGFVLVAVLGFRFNHWLLVAALAGHGLFDLLHGHVIANPGVPAWWPMFCMTYDVTAAGYLAWLLFRKAAAARMARPGPASE
ncbi:MAG: hypothetical protein ABI790_11200 [Betaproteobacteria bacterium]